MPQFQGTAGFFEDWRKRFFMERSDDGSRSAGGLRLKARVEATALVGWLRYVASIACVASVACGVSWRLLSDLLR